MTYDKPKFIRLWRRSGSALAVAKALRLDPAIVRSRASYIRRTGTVLKLMRPGRKAVR